MPSEHSHQDDALHGSRDYQHDLDDARFIVGLKMKARAKSKTIANRSTVIIAIVLAILVGLFFLLNFPKSTWALEAGMIQDTKIIVDHALETKWGSQPTWKAEYKVAYFVANREYEVWVDSGH